MPPTAAIDAASVAALDHGQAVFLDRPVMTGHQITLAGAERRHGLLAVEVAAEAGIGQLVYSSPRRGDAYSGIPR